MYDMSQIRKLKALGAAAPAAFEAYAAFDKAALAEGAIPARTKSLIAIAVAMTTQCPYCIEIHAKRARAAGCSDSEISESVMVAAALRAGAAVTHGAHALPSGA